TVPWDRAAWRAWTARGCPWTSERAIGGTPSHARSGCRRQPGRRSRATRILRTALGAPPAPEPWLDRRLRGAGGLAPRTPGAERGPSVPAGPARRGLPLPGLPPAPDGGPLPGGGPAHRAAPGARAVLDAGPDLRVHPPGGLAALEDRPGEEPAAAEDPPLRAGRHAVPDRHADHRPARVPHRLLQPARRFGHRLGGHRPRAPRGPGAPGRRPGSPD